MIAREWFGEDCCGTCRFYWSIEPGILLCSNEKSEHCWEEKEPRDICDDYEEEEK